MSGWIFPGHFSKLAPIYQLSGNTFKIFIHQAKLILQTFFCTTIFRRAFCTKIFNLMCVWICMVGCFQVTTQNFLLFVTFKGMLSKLLYVKQNPYYSLLCALEFTVHCVILNLEKSKNLRPPHAFFPGVIAPHTIRVKHLNHGHN